jgi:hypothetical protein
MARSSFHAFRLLPPCTLPLPHRNLPLHPPPPPFPALLPLPSPCILNMPLALHLFRHVGWHRCNAETNSRSDACTDQENTPTPEQQEQTPAPTKAEPTPPVEHAGAECRRRYLQIFQGSSPRMRRAINQPKGLRQNRCLPHQQNQRQHPRRNQRREPQQNLLWRPHWSPRQHRPKRRNLRRRLHLMRIINRRPESNGQDACEALQAHPPRIAYDMARHGARAHMATTC